MGAPSALPAARQVEAAWGVSNYRHGGLMSGIEHINHRHAFDSGFDNVSGFAQVTSVRQIQGGRPEQSKTLVWRKRVWGHLPILGWNDGTALFSGRSDQGGQFPIPAYAQERLRD